MQLAAKFSERLLEKTVLFQMSISQTLQPYGMARENIAWQGLEMQQQRHLICLVQRKGMVQEHKRKFIIIIILIIIIIIIIIF